MWCGCFSSFSSFVMIRCLVPGFSSPSPVRLPVFLPPAQTGFWGGLFLPSRKLVGHPGWMIGWAIVCTLHLYNIFFFLLMMRVSVRFLT